MTLAYPRYIKSLASASRTADTELAFGPAEGAQGLVVTLNATAKTSSPSVVFTIQGYDEASDTWYPVLASAAVTDVTTSPVVLRVHPNLTAVTNLAASSLLVAKMRVLCDHSNADALTYTVGIAFTA